MGMGAMANAVISPNSKAIIGFDIVNPGFNYLTPPFANLVDECGNGSGGTLRVQTRPYSGGDPQKGGLEIKNIIVTAPGDGYLPAPDGSLGGNGRVWKGVNEGYVERSDGSYYVVPSGQEPSNLPPEDKFIPPQPPTQPGFQAPTQPGFQAPTQSGFQAPTQPGFRAPTYPAVTEIEEVFVDDPGFGYEPGDTLEVIPNNGSILEPVINDRGEITQVKVINPGIGFIDLPEININSPRGYNAKLIPVLKVTPIVDIPDPTIIPTGTRLVSVVDCVGKILPRAQFDIVPR
jgi:hypothetical protein